VQQLAEKTTRPCAGVSAVGGQLTSAAVGAAHGLPSVTPVEALNLG
jgi:hypothetical protein